VHCSGQIAYGKVLHLLASTCLVSHLCKMAGFKGYFTKHSLRATAATRFSDIDEQLIMVKTQDRSRLHCSAFIQARQLASGGMQEAGVV